MLELIAAVLILIGFATCVVVGAVALSVWLEERVVEVRPPDPAEQSLAAAGRISAVAFEAEQLMHAAAQQAKREEESR